MIWELTFMIYIKFQKYEIPNSHFTIVGFGFWNLKDAVSIITIPISKTLLSKVADCALGCEYALLDIPDHGLLNPCFLAEVCREGVLHPDVDVHAQAELPNFAIGL